MNDNRLFDEHIKEQFSNYAPDVPAHIWENIVAGRERRRPAGFWFTFFTGRNIALLIALLLAGGAGSWWLLKGDSAPAPEKNIAQQTQQITQNSSTPVVASVSPGNKNNVAANDDNSAVTSATGRTDVIAADQNNASSSSAGHDLSTTKTNSTSSIPYYVSGKKTDDNSTTPGNKKSGKLVNVLSKDNITTTNPGLENDDLTGQGTLMGRLLPNFDAFAISKKQNSGLRLRLTPFSYLPGCPTFEKDAAANKKYFSIYGGPDFVIRSLTDTGNSAYLQKRKESAKVSSAYSAGITYTKVFNNSMSLRTGINYSQINEKFTFVQGNIVTVTYIINANGDTTGSYVTTGTRYKTTHNKYRSVDVPLLVGYEMGNGRLHANVNAGVVVNVYSWQKGEVLDTAYQPVNITTGKGNSPYQFKTNAGLGFMGGVSVYYKLNDNVHLMAEPYFRYNFKQMNKDNLTLKQKYNTVGLRVGLRVDLH